MKQLGILLPLLSLVACGPSEEQVKREKKNQEVWDAHDAVMPKMDDIMMAEKSLNRGISTMKSDSSLMDSIWFNTALETNNQLLKAHDGMMTWMRAYEYPGDSISFDDAMKYMESERIIISEIGVQTDNAIAQADSLSTVFQNIESANNEK